MGEALLKQTTVNEVVLLDTELIMPSPNQPRTEFKQAELESLAESIKSNGLLQPLTVRLIKDIGYELICGERRLRASKLVGLEKIPCIIVETTDRQAAVLAVLENLQREDLNYFEEAHAYKNLIEEWGLSQAELGIRLGKAQPTIANKLRLLKYDDETQQIILQSGINERQARSLTKIQEPKKLIKAISYILKHQLNSAQTEQYIKSLTDNKGKGKQYKPVVKDVRLFFNTMNNAIKLMNQSGINASAEKIDNGDYIEYIVRIPNSNSVSR